MGPMSAALRPLRPRHLVMVALALALACQASVAAAEDLGPPIGSLFACERPGVTPPRCTSVGDSPRHYVAFDGSLTEPLRVALHDTMVEDYGPTDLVMIEQAAPNGLTDVIAFSADYGENGAAGWVTTSSNIVEDFPTGCYWDPWYGYICGVAQPTKSGTFLSYGVGGGLRWDVNQWLFFRGAARQQWIDLPNTGVPSFTIFKLDVGFKF